MELYYRVVMTMVTGICLGVVIALVILYIDHNIRRH